MILGQLPNPKTMKTSYINPQQKLPFLVEPIDQKHSKEDLLQWMKANAELVKKHFYEDGALLFRGFDINTPKDFEDLALQVDPGLKNDYYGTSPRNIVKNTTYIYTASELPGYYPIMQHCEMSYVPQPPISLFFFCHIEPEYPEVPDAFVDAHVAVGGAGSPGDEIAAVAGLYDVFGAVVVAAAVVVLPLEVAVCVGLDDPDILAAVVVGQIAVEGRGFAGGNKTAVAGGAHGAGLFVRGATITFVPFNAALRQGGGRPKQTQ